MDLVTARNGIVVGSGITLSKDGDGFFTGIVTATTFSGTFSGDGSTLTGVASTDNIRTNTNATFLQNINVSGLTTTGIISAFTNTDGTTDLLTLHADADGTNNGVASIKFTGNTGNHSAYIKGGHTTNGDTILTFHTDDYASGFNPEERLRIDSAGRLLLGHTSSQTIGSNSHGLSQINVTANQPVLTLARFENVAAGPSLVLGKSRASSAGSYTVVQNGDGLGSISFSGADGTDLVTVGALVEAQVDGTPGSNDMPTRLVFSTTKDGESSPTESNAYHIRGYIIHY